jgi:spermidine/putrescine transport system ATP-binding protein
MDYAVELRNVTKKFKGVRGRDVIALDQVSLAVRNGEFFSLLGPSGCGKSTTLRLIGGFEIPDEGEIMIMGKPMGEIPPYRRPVNIVFQNYALFPHMTVAENVAFGLRMDGVQKSEMKKRVKEALAMVQLSEMENRKPKQLSGGQQQRVALARALVKRPSVLLLDEPLGALDRKLRKAMQLELKHMQQNVGITFIYVTHDQEEAITMSDRIAVMSNGHVLQVGTPAEIYEKPNCKFVADFIGESNFIHGVVGKVQSGLAEVVIDQQLSLIVPTSTGKTNVGDTATIMFRPEKGSLVREQCVEPGYCSLPGRILEVIYLGEDVSYVVGLTKNQSAMVRVQNKDLSTLGLYQPGDAVYLRLALEHLQLFQE